MEISFFGRRLSMLMLIVCALVGSSVSPYSRPSQSACSGAVENQRAILAVVHAFGIEQDSQEQQLRTYLFGCLPSAQQIGFFVNGPAFNNAVAKVWKAVERYATPELRLVIDETLGFMNSNHGHVPSSKIVLESFDKDYSNALMSIGRVIESEFSKIIPREDVPGFKQLMKDHVYPFPPTMGNWVASKGQSVASALYENKGLVAGLAITAALIGGGYMLMNSETGKKWLSTIQEGLGVAKDAQGQIAGLQTTWLGRQFLKLSGLKPVASTAAASAATAPAATATTGRSWNPFKKSFWVASADSEATAQPVAAPQPAVSVAPSATSATPAPQRSFLQRALGQNRTVAALQPQEKALSDLSDDSDSVTSADSATPAQPEATRSLTQRISKVGQAVGTGVSNFTTFLGSSLRRAFTVESVSGQPLAAGQPLDCSAPDSPLIV